MLYERENGNRCFTTSEEQAAWMTEMWNDERFIRKINGIGYMIQQYSIRTLNEVDLMIGIFYN